MLLNGAHSDRIGERALHCIVPCLVMAVCFLAAGFATAPWLAAAAVAVAYIASVSMLGPALAVPTEFLAGRAAAAGIAAMNTITMFSGFVGPYWMGVMKDATGSYQAGLRGLALPSLLAAGMMFALTLSLARSRSVAEGASLAPESA